MKKHLLILTVVFGIADDCICRKGQCGCNADQPGAQISKHIYGHFAEHLGNCIYGSIWVGRNRLSPTPMVIATT